MRFVSAVVAVVMVSGIEYGRAQTQGPPGAAPTPAPVEIEPVVVERPNRVLLAGGVVIGGGAYGLSLSTTVLYLALIFPFQAAFGCDDPADTPMQLAIPIAGPLIAANNSYVQDNNETELRNLFYLDAGLQAAGLLMFASAFLFKEEVLVGGERAGPPRYTLGAGPRGSAGLSLGGSW